MLKYLLGFISISYIYINLFNKPKKNKKIENFTNSSDESELLNIYDKPLVSCKVGNMSNGSWDKDGKCSELDGGVHQICIKNISKNTNSFSKVTGQSNWSENRDSNNHCVCLGAWSLYNKKNKTSYNSKKILKCDAIPKKSLSLDYVSRFKEGWNKWNGIELNNQIKEGVESLIQNCYDPNKKKSENLRKNYCNFSKDVKVLRNSSLYKELCS